MFCWHLLPSSPPCKTFIWTTVEMFIALKIMRVPMEAINKWNAVENAIWKIWSFAKQHPIMQLKRTLPKSWQICTKTVILLMMKTWQEIVHFMKSVGCVSTCKISSYIKSSLQKYKVTAYLTELVAFPLLPFILQTTGIFDNLALPMNWKPVHYTKT